MQVVMKRDRICALGILFQISFIGMNSASAGRPTYTPQRDQRPLLRNRFVVEKVRLNYKNTFAESFTRLTGRYVNCAESFQGTQDGNKLYIRVEGHGGAGRYRHLLSYELSDSYELGTKDAGLQQKTHYGNGIIEVKLPPLKEEVPFVQQTFFLLTKDRSGQWVSTSKIFKISHHIQLEKTISELSCYQRYEPQIASAVMRNQTTSLSQIDIRQSVEKLYGKARNWQFGVYLNPTVGVQGLLFSLFSLNYNYFTEISKQSIEVTDYTQQFSLNPGDYFQIYRQDTRLVNAYHAEIVGACGEVRKLPQAYLIQSWMHAFHAVPIDPGKMEAPLLESIGAKVENTCQESFTPGKTDGSPESQGQFFHPVFPKVQ